MPDVTATAGEAPYEEYDVRSRPDPMSIQVIREDGLFVLRQQVIWKLEDEQDWPYLLFRVRYRFAVDPLAAFVINRRASFYDYLTPPIPASTIACWMLRSARCVRSRELESPSRVKPP